MTTIVFDIETGPLPETELLAMLPAFDPAEVKTGNIKDPEKVAAKIAEAKASHERDFIDRAALDPLTGQVIAIGVMACDASGETKPVYSAGEFSIIAYENEADTLRGFWELLDGEMGRLNPLIGFNICNFDLPFLFRRSWKHHVPVPYGLRRGRYWGDQVIDLRDIWQLGDRQARGSLDSIAKHLGVGAKNGEGKDFARLWQTDRKQAEAYLQNDLVLTAKVADALGISI
jgi:DNA polymerase elongation subunit (family B)